jgi:Tfp pilus assembly protein PilE
MRRGYGVSRNGQAGFGALEVLIGLMIAALATAAGATAYSHYLDRQANIIASGQMNQVADAASSYIKDNYASVLAVATPSSTAVITTAMLRATGYLPAGFSDTNAYGQTYLVLALEPTANKLQTLIITQNGEVIKDLYLIEVAKQIGARGGYISSSNTAVANGSFGGWQSALSQYGVAPGAGHLATALFFDDGAVVNDYLYRSAVPGQPNLNRMNTAIDMGGNNLNNTGTVNAAATAISGNAVVQGDTITGNWFRTTGDTGWYSEKYGGGWYMTDPDWVRSYTDKNVYTGGQMRAGTLVSQGRTEVGEYLQLDAVANVGDGCSPNGLVGRSASGSTLSCVNGQWTNNGGVVGQYQYLGYFEGTSNFTSGANALLIQVSGGAAVACGIGTINNEYNISGIVNGTTVAVANNNNVAYNKTGNLTFAVPANSSYSIQSNPYMCEGHGQYTAWAFKL